tara:strand:- start:710 stop:1273 length:564 start_codon:yes stop_codon:yes gene_type:complete
MLSLPESPLWDFSIRVYALPDVADACLSLQDEQGADINMVFFCLWISRHKDGRLSRTQLEQFLADVTDWQHQVVKPLRALRRELKEAKSVLPLEFRELVRSTIKRAELESEHAEQIFLAGLVTATSESERPSPEAAAMDAAENLAQYLSLLKVRSSTAIREKVEVLLSATFPDVPREKIAILARYET